MRLFAALAVLLAAPFAAAQSSSPEASTSTWTGPSAVHLTSLPTGTQHRPPPRPGPGTPSSTALPVADKRNVTFVTPNKDTAHWAKGRGQLTVEWTPLLSGSSYVFVGSFELWMAHTNVSMLGPNSSDISNNYRVLQRGLDTFRNNASATFSASVLNSVVPGPGFVVALIDYSDASHIFAVSEPFEIKPEGSPGAGGRRVALHSAAGLLVGAAGVLAGAVLLV